jgi:uracil DNA glycosylase
MATSPPPAPIVSHLGPQAGRTIHPARTSKMTPEQEQNARHKRHIVHEAPHPSPFSVKGCRGHAGFAETNAELERRARPAIEWRLL